MSGGIVILGAGQAAAQLAVSLRQGGHDGPIRMVGDERYAPYQRPPLSKAFLRERPAADSLLLRGPHYWADHRVELDVGTAATVDRARKLVGLRDGRSFDYDTLVFATGTRARDLPLPGIDRPGVFSLRKIDDVRLLRPALDDARRIVIIGGGYIGLEVAAVMRQEGRDAIVVEAEGRVMKRVAGETISGFFDGLHRARGVDIRLSCRLASIDGDDNRATGITLASGERIAADLVLVATGARANDDLAAAAGLPCEEGIVVDDFARAAPDVYAIGDCARFFSHRYGRRIRLECVQNAIDQAKAAADAMLGKAKRYDPVPWFWSDQYEIKLQITGLLDSFPERQAIPPPQNVRVVHQQDRVADHDPRQHDHSDIRLKTEGRCCQFERSHHSDGRDGD